jgi:hypothetical protein
MLIQGSVSTREGRFARTGLFAVLAGGWGSMVFKNVHDSVLAAPFFVLTTLATTALAYELFVQAHRRSEDDVSRWEHTDTAIVAVLIGLAAVSCVASALRSFTSPEQTAGVSFAALYVVMAGLFSWNRWAMLSRL